MAKIKRKIIKPDPLYNSVEVSKFINKIMRDGKKNASRKIVYGAFDIIKEKLKKEPIDIFIAAIDNVSPILEVKSKRVGGATYQVPVEVKSERKLTLAIRWIIKGARDRKGKSMKENFSLELIDAFNNTGWAIKKKIDTHKMAEANRAFAHFAW